MAICDIRNLPVKMKGVVRMNGLIIESCSPLLATRAMFLYKRTSTVKLEYARVPHEAASALSWYSESKAKLESEPT